jgi:hypothetical protein
MRLVKELERMRLQDGVVFLDEYATAHLMPNHPEALHLRPYDWKSDI